MMELEKGRFVLSVGRLLVTPSSPLQGIQALPREVPCIFVLENEGGRQVRREYPFEPEGAKYLAQLLLQVADPDFKVPTVPMSELNDTILAAVPS